jgi:radical SAM protein with 4Fe4S-binding SPASM domain
VAELPGDVRTHRFARHIAAQAPAEREQQARLLVQRVLAHPRCRECEEFHVCNGACPLYWRRMGFDELREVKGFDPPGREHFAR